jgi:diguanylate cyclase
MAHDTHFDLVRETLKALSERKLVATPDNYQRVYDEILAMHPDSEDAATIREALLKLLMLVIDNMTVLTADETWLHGQMVALRRATEPPLSLHRLDRAGGLLQDVITKQGAAKSRADQAQAELRTMLAVFLERLTSMTETSGLFQGKLENSVKRIEAAKSIEEIAPVLREVISATRAMSEESLQVRDELRSIKARTEATEAELNKLYTELNRLSNQARHDTLTGVLNRQGMEEALDIEIARVRRQDSSLCLAMLDIDNFKKINDSRGHAAGDEALSHLAQVVREALRPQDTLARYGGEEFVVILPETVLDDGVQALRRLQRELTARLFLSGQDKILITFSAGVAQLGTEETGLQALKRADLAMYQAKRAGKNRVVGI